MYSKYSSKSKGVYYNNHKDHFKMYIVSKNTSGWSLDFRFEPAT